MGGGVWPVTGEMKLQSAVSSEHLANVAVTVHMLVLATIGKCREAMCRSCITWHKGSRERGGPSSLARCVSWAGARLTPGNGWIVSAEYYCVVKVVF